MRNAIVTCPVDDFINHYLPFAPAPVDITGGREELIAQGHLSKDDKWANFPQSPSSREGDENVVFESIGEIVNSLARLELTSSVAGSLKRTHRVYYAKPNANIMGETEGCGHIVGGILCPQTIEGAEENTSDVALSFKYKKRSDNKSVTQNRHYMVSTARDIMNNDPRRLFTYGITIEDALVSVWYFSRSHSAKSKEFNFVENPDLLITVLFSFLFATNESVGFDPNIQRYPAATERGSRRITYIYRLVEKDKNGDDKERYFETQRTISKPRSLCITDCATHVMEAKELSSEFGEPPVYKENTRTVVLRDAWLNEGLLTEREIQTAIFEDLEMFARNLPPDGSSPHFADFDDAMKTEILGLLKDEKYRAYFLTISCESVGSKSKDVHPNATADPLLLSQMQPRSITSHFTTQPTRDCQPKRPYRLIYEEYCLDLHSKKLTSIRKAFVALRDALTALTLLFCAGWVHCDVSSGNVLLWMNSDGKPRGKLGDLEYAKRFPSTSGSSNPKMGTPYFMAVEVAKNQYIPAPLKWGAIKAAVPSPVRHNFQHDLESLWWLTLWIVTCRVGNLKLMEKMQPIFVTDLRTGPFVRSALLSDPVGLRGYLQDLHPSLEGFSSSLAAVCRLLWISYSEQTESGERTAVGPYSEMYMAMRQMLSTTIVRDPPRMMNGMWT